MVRLIRKDCTQPCGTRCEYGNSFKSNSCSVWFAWLFRVRVDVGEVLKISWPGAEVGCLVGMSLAGIISRQDNLYISRALFQRHVSESTDTGIC